MTATNSEDAKTIIMGFAMQLVNTSDQQSTIAAAQDRGWLDKTGAPTEEGRKLANSLADQSQTRTVFRNY